MFGFSFSELIVVLLVAVLCIRPKDWPEIAHFIGRMIFRGKKIIAAIKNSVAEIEKTSEIAELKAELNRGLTSEKLKENEEDETTIVDIYGNEHKVSGLSELRSDLGKSELEDEIKAANLQNTGQKNIGQNLGKSPKNQQIAKVQSDDL